MNSGRGVAAVIAIFLAVPALAQVDERERGFYIGTSVVRIEDNGDEAPSIYPIAVGIKGGLQINRNIAVEARYSSGVRKDDGTVSGISYDLELDYLYGLYAKCFLPLGGVSPFLLLGYSKGQESIEVAALGLTDSASDSGFSYGIGIDVPINDSISFNAEWARLVEGTDNQGVGFVIKGVSLGVAMRF